MNRTVKKTGLEPAGSGTEMIYDRRSTRNKKGLKRYVQRRQVRRVLLSQPLNRWMLNFPQPPVTTLPKPPINCKQQPVRPQGRALPRAIDFNVTSIVNLLEDDDGPHTSESADAAPENAEKIEKNEQRCHERRVSLSEVREKEYDQQKERHNSTAP